ncbi:MAG: CGNR zinc finger domain-containing protein [Dehalococcoidia bacterium]|nr:CGNR zinc finger domain-containing protein [Dehalococcoidia bacterium]
MQGCGWAYYDESKNGSKKWCAMGLCGTRAKMKAYRERKKAGAQEGPGGSPGAETQSRATGRAPLAARPGRWRRKNLSNSSRS